MHLLWDPRTLLILIQPTPSSSVRLPPHHAKTAIVAWNSHQHNNPLSLSLSPTLANPFRKDCVGASAVTMQAISLLPPSLPLMQHVTLALSLSLARLSRIWPLGVAGTGGVGCILAAAGA